MRKVLKTAPMFDDVYLEGWDFDGADVLNRKKCTPQSFFQRGVLFSKCSMVQDIGKNYVHTIFCRTEFWCLK